MKVIVPISVGELLDKISILQIKSQFTDSQYVYKEKEYLTEIAKENNVYDQNFLNKLFDINSKLWEIEDKLREYEKSQLFDDEFVELARSVYVTNDERSKVKKEINDYTGSEFHEIKIYK